MTRVALYARVSSKKQKDRHTIDSQLEYLREWAAREGVELVAEYADDGVSGWKKKLAERPAGTRMLADAEAGRFAELWFYKTDRFGRNMLDTLQAAEVLTQAGVRVRSATEPFDLATPAGVMQFQMGAVWAEFQRKTALQDQLRGRDAAIRDGRWTGGPIPFGYRLDDRLRLVPGEQAALAREVFRRYADGTPLRALARWLNAIGAPTARVYSSGRRCEKSPVWGPSRLREMLRSTTYRGSRTVDVATGAITHETPALVDEVTWARAQARLAANKHKGRPAADEPYLLTGLLRCGRCERLYGGNSVTRKRGARYRYYRCAGHDYLPGGAVRHCDGKVGRADGPDGWETLAWADALRVLRDPGAHLERAHARLHRRAAELDEGAGRIGSLEARLRERDAAASDVLLLLDRQRITLAQADARLEAINAEKATLVAELELLRGRLRLVEVHADRLRELEAFLAEIRDTVEAIDASDDRPRKRRLLEFLYAEWRVETTGDGHHKTATLVPTYNFDPTLLGTVHYGQPYWTLDKAVLAF